MAKIKKKLLCPKCGKEIWDLPYGYKLAKCWNCMLAFDTMKEEEDD